MSFFSEKVEKIEPYTPGEQPKDGKYIKLNTNENPYPPSDKVKEAISKCDLNRLRLYSDPECTELRNEYAKVLNVKPENIFVGNGSDEVLATAFQSFFMGKKDILVPNISYSFYPVYANLYNVEMKEIPLKEEFEIDIEEYKVKNNGIILANPNAPTSLALTKQQIIEVLDSNLNSPIIIDEAYVEFGAETVVDLIKKYENLIVIKTLSKSHSLAGLRVGFAIGNEKLIEGMNKIKNSFNSYPIDMIAQIRS